MTQEHPARSLEQQTTFLSSLIQTGPLYESASGQLACAEMLSAELTGFGWDDVNLHCYRAGELANHPSYVPVASFGEQYAADESRVKTNVIGVIEADSPGKTLILNGHYDVEPIANPDKWDAPWNSGEVRQGRVWGRGAADMLGGLSSQLYVASRFAQDRKSWAGRIIFNAVADEEVGGNGTLASLLELRSGGLLNGPDIACLIAEPSDRVIGLESLGFLHMIVKAQGEARHMAGGQLRDNVLYKILEVINDFDKSLGQAIRTVNSEAQHARHTFGIIGGGTDAATPMDSIQAEATILYPVDTPAAELQKEIARLLLPRGVEVSFSDFNFAGQRSLRGPLVRSLDVTRLDDTISLGIFPSPCDARLFSDFGIREVVTYGPGSLAQAHAANEFIELDAISSYNTHLEMAMVQYLTKDQG